MIGGALIAGGLFVGYFFILWLVARWQRPRRVARLLVQRPNLSLAEYCAAMPDVDADVAEWLWDEVQIFCRPDLTPHPQDEITDDLAIDPDEPDFWFMDFCEQHNLPHRNFPDWPKGEVVTVHSFALWLSEGRGAMRKMP